MNAIRQAESTDAALPARQGELILVIDDDEDMLELTKTVLKSRGYRVVIAQDGLEGVARFKENLNDTSLVITDAGMPGMDGMGVIRAIQELKPNLPMIVSSGSEDDTEQLRRVDPVHLKGLRKPYSLDELLVVVDAALHH